MVCLLDAQRDIHNAGVYCIKSGVSRVFLIFIGCTEQNIILVARPKKLASVKGLHQQLLKYFFQKTSALLIKSLNQLMA